MFRQAVYRFAGNRSNQLRFIRCPLPGIGYIPSLRPNIHLHHREAVGTQELDFVQWCEDEILTYAKRLLSRNRDDEAAYYVLRS